LPAELLDMAELSHEPERGWPKAIACGARAAAADEEDEDEEEVEDEEAAAAAGDRGRTSRSGS
jgi:hypothetical protein